MHRVIDISLAGHAEPYRLHDDAFEALQQYLDRARAGLAGDPDHTDVLRDLEQSIGDKLDARLRDGKRVIDAADVGAVLDEIGAVDADAPAPAGTPPALPPRPRRAADDACTAFARDRSGQASAMGWPSTPSSTSAWCGGCSCSWRS